MSTAEPTHLDDGELRFLARAGGRGAPGRDRRAPRSLPGVLRRLDRLDTPDPLLVRMRDTAGLGESPGDSALREPPSSLPTANSRPPHSPARRPRPGPPPPADDEAPTGEGTPRRIGDYDVLGEVGRGGMGVVYKARQRRLNGWSALKVILEGRRARRSRGSGSAWRPSGRRVQHPNIVQVYDVGEHDGLPFLAMEWVEGGSLADRLDGRPLDPAAAAAWSSRWPGRSRCSTRAGVIHRDLKPANVLLRPRSAEADRRLATGLADSPPTPKVADFGMAKRSRGDGGLSGTGSSSGTPQLHGPRAGRGAGHGRPGGGRLRPRRDPLRAAHRPPAVPRR